MTPNQIAGIALREAMASLSRSENAFLHATLSKPATRTAANEEEKEEGRGGGRGRANAHDKPSSPSSLISSVLSVKDREAVQSLPRFLIAISLAEGETLRKMIHWGGPSPPQRSSSSSSSSSGSAGGRGVFSGGAFSGVKGCALALRMGCSGRVLVRRN